MGVQTVRGPVCWGGCPVYEGLVRGGVQSVRGPVLGGKFSTLGSAAAALSSSRLVI